MRVICVIDPAASVAVERAVEQPPVVLRVVARRGDAGSEECAVEAAGGAEYRVAHALGGEAPGGVVVEERVARVEFGGLTV